MTIQVRLVQDGGTIDIGFLGANPDPVVIGSGDLPGVSHYYLGNDPTAWIENVPHYAEVTYADITGANNTVLNTDGSLSLEAANSEPRAHLLDLRRRRRRVPPAGGRVTGPRRRRDRRLPMHDLELGLPAWLRCAPHTASP